MKPITRKGAGDPNVRFPRQIRRRPSADITSASHGIGMIGPKASTTPPSPVEFSNLAQIASCVRVPLVLENRHGRAHAPKPELPIEALSPRHRV